MKLLIVFLHLRLLKVPINFTLTNYFPKVNFVIQTLFLFFALILIVRGEEEDGFPIPLSFETPVSSSQHCQQYSFFVSYFTTRYDNNIPFKTECMKT